MHEISIILILLFASGLSYVCWPLLPRVLSRRLCFVLYAALTAATALSMFDFTRPWVFPLFFGLLVGGLLSIETTTN